MGYRVISLPAPVYIVTMPRTRISNRVQECFFIIDRLHHRHPRPLPECPGSEVDNCSVHTAKSTGRHLIKNNQLARFIYFRYVYDHEDKGLVNLPTPSSERLIRRLTRVRRGAASPLAPI